MKSALPTALQAQPLKDVTGANATDIFTSTGHGFVADDAVIFSDLTGGANLSTTTKYYVISANLTTDTFQVSATQGGSAFTSMSTDLTAGKVQKLSTWKNNKHFFSQVEQGWLAKYWVTANGTLPTDASIIDTSILSDFYLNRRLPA